LITKSVPSLISLVPMFVLQMLLGALIGYIAGRTMVYIVNNLRLEYEGLYPVLTFALILIFYSGATIIGGNGFLTVYLAGIIMGNNEFIHKRSLIRFHDGIAWLMQISMFLTLGLFVFPSELLPLTGIGLLVSVVLMFLARPAGVFITLIFSSINLREKLLISWVGLRGAVPIILATFPLTAGIEQADMIFNLVFFIVLTSALFQGSSIPIVAKWLRVDAPLEQEEEETPKAEEGKPIIYRLGEIRVPEDSNLVNKRIVEARIPEAVEIVLIGRGNQIITPTGSTIIKPDDVLLILADEDSLKQLMEMLEP
ncbi:MAG TPA: potassium/proton antiporter, partial [Armatimonadota bacterium]|nr:potassium/proton antiporter [Armatimonadota bacterium]